MVSSGFSIINKIPVGATIHEIDNELDHGNIIAREFVEKLIVDTSDTLYDKIIDKEIELINKWLEPIVYNNYTAIPPEQEGWYIINDIIISC